MAEGMTRACAIIVAGGSGTRFGNPGGKLLIEVAGKPLITWTLEAFDAADLARDHRRRHRGARCRR